MSAQSEVVEKYRLVAANGTTEPSLPDDLIGEGGLNSRQTRRYHGEVTDRTVVESYSRIAESYFEHKKDKSSFPNVVDLPVLMNLVNGYAENGVVADFCAGTGWATYNIAKHTTAREIVAVELSQPMLEIAKREIVDPRVRFVETSVTDTGLIESGTDLVVSTYGLDCVVDLRGALREARRILAPGGRLIALIKHPQRNRLYIQNSVGVEAVEGYSSWYEEVFPGAKEKTDDQFKLVPVLRRYMSEAQWWNELTGAGFVIVGVHEPLPDSSVREISRSVWEEYVDRKSSIIFSAVNIK